MKLIFLVLFYLIALSSCDTLVVRESDRKLWNENIEQGKTRIVGCLRALEKKPSVIDFKIKVFKKGVFGTEASTTPNRHSDNEKKIFDIIFDGKIQKDNKSILCIVKILESLTYNLSDSRFSFEIIEPRLILK